MIRTLESDSTQDCKLACKNVRQCADLLDLTARMPRQTAGAEEPVSPTEEGETAGLPLLAALPKGSWRWLHFIRGDCDCSSDPARLGLEE